MFPVGSVNGDVMCAIIDTIHDFLFEKNEYFFIDIMSLNENITVVIHDPDRAIICIIDDDRKQLFDHICDKLMY